MTGASPPRLPDYLGHIVEAIHRARRYVVGHSDASFASDEKSQDAVMRNIEVMGEAARNVLRHHPDFAAAHPDAPWALMVGMRNRVSPGYFAVDWDLIWATVQNDLPVLDDQVTSLLVGLAPAGSA